ncbi:ataxin-2 homolog [Zingiber officinale]|uniref:ataxin-2 homolog n=1 Tax=Zingiber officinale TaxID=94328 RepID=UPI001C4B731A|nr:ataxin-2 homolog [Zingiber officinale]
MASGESSGRAAASDSRSFDFGSDDILCSYDDFSAQDTSVGKRSDPSGKDLHENSMGRPLVSIYEQEDYSREGVLPSVEKCIKKYADNLLRSLDGICGRLSQLEIVCYKLERSVGELRADFTHDQNEKDVKFKFLEKHLQEVHRSVQVLRDKQELVETQRELVKLQLAQKAPEKNENTNVREASEPKSQNETPDTGNQQLALALPRQTDQTVPPAGTSQQVQPYKELSKPQQAPAPPNIQQDQVMPKQVGNYYGQHQTVLQDQHNQPVQPETQYIQPGSQLHNRSHQAPPQLVLSVNQNQPPPFPQYLQQLPPQPDQHLQQQIASQAQIRSPPPPSYTPYPSQPVNPGPETFPSSVPMQVPNPVIVHPGGIRPEAFPYGYGGSGSTASQPPPPLHHGIQQPMQPPVSQSSFTPQLGKGGSYMGTPPYPPPSHNIPGYNAAYNYPPSNLPAARNQQVPPPTHQYNSQSIHNHPYGEMIEKAINMGFDKNQVINVVQRMSDSGQPMDFNSLLDRLNGQAGGTSARAR